MSLHGLITVKRITSKYKPTQTTFNLSFYATAGQYTFFKHHYGQHSAPKDKAGNYDFKKSAIVKDNII